MGGTGTDGAGGGGPPSQRAVLWVGVCCTAAAPGTVREEDMLGCMKHTEVKRTEQSPGGSGRLGCLTLLSFPQPPGLDQPWDFIPDCAAFCNPLPSSRALSPLPLSPSPCLLLRRSRGCSEPRVKPKNVSPEQVLLCSTSLAPAWRPPAHPHSPGSGEGSEPASTARPRVEGNSPWAGSQPTRAGCSVLCPPPSSASLCPRAPRVLQAPRLSPRRLEGRRHGREQHLQESRNVLPGELLCASSLVRYSWKQLLQPRNARMPRYWGAWILGCLRLGYGSPAAFGVHH